MNRIKSSIRSVLFKTIHVEPGEGRALLWSFSYFFSLLCSYYIIRPMRDEMGILGGVENLQWLFTGTLLVMTAVIPLFGWVSSRFPRHQFLPCIYLFFIVMLLLFYGLMGGEVPSKYVARAFFIWVSVFNLFVVSVFWSFMADLYSNAQARRLFAFIAARRNRGSTHRSCHNCLLGATPWSEKFTTGVGLFSDVGDHMYWQAVAMVGIAV